MSIAVDLETLGDEVVGRGFGYLLTAGDDGRPKAVVVVPEVLGARLRFELGIGDGTVRNVAARPAVSVVFPPTADDDMSLLVDGDALVETSADDRRAVVVTPTWAVRHRPAPRP